MPKITEFHCKTLQTHVHSALQQSNITNSVDFLALDAETLAKKTGIAFKDLVALRGILLAESSAFAQDGESLLNEARETIAILSTGCKSIDTILGGGVYTSELTEICGSGSSGKSQVCLNLALHVAWQSEQPVVYIDSGGAFHAQRLQHVLQQSQCTQQEAEQVCGRIQWFPVFDVYELITVLENIRHQLYAQDGGCFSSVKLLIIDCMTSLLSPLLGQGQTEGYGIMNQITRLLKPMAVEFSIAVVITNNIVEWDGELRPALGRGWAGVPNTRLQLYTPSLLEHLSHERGLERDMAATNGGDGGDGKNRKTIKAMLVKSTKQKTGRVANFHITDAGLTD